MYFSLLLKHLIDKEIYFYSFCESKVYVSEAKYLIMDILVAKRVLSAFKMYYCYHLV